MTFAGASGTMSGSVFSFSFPGPASAAVVFPKDVRALIYTSRQKDVPLALLEAVDRVNEAQKRVLVKKIRKHYGDGSEGKDLRHLGPGLQAADG